MESSEKGGVLVSTLTDPSREKAAQFGARALRYTVEADGNELAETGLVISGKVKPHVQKTFALSAADALASVERGHSVGKVVLKVA